MRLAVWSAWRVTSPWIKRQRWRHSKEASRFASASLDKAIERMWGYASNEARHVVEGQQPMREEAELVVGMGRDDGDISEQKNRQSDVNGSGTCLQTFFD